MRQSAVSIVVPVFNGEAYLAEALESIFAQSRPALEVIVVDDGSTDASSRVARSFEGIRVLGRPHQGVAHAWNAGITAASGDLICFLAQDDIWSRDKLEVQVNYMEDHPHVQYTVAQMKIFLQPGCPLPAGFRKELLDDIQVGRIPETLMARRSVFDIVGMFDTGLTTAQDVDWFARAKDHDLTMGVLPEVLLQRRIHTKNFTFTAPIEDLNNNLLKVVRDSIRRQRKDNLSL